MLASEQRTVNNVTYFELPKQDERGNWSVKATRNGVCVKMTYCATYEDCIGVRDEWINQFWGYQLS